MKRVDRAWESTERPLLLFLLAGRALKYFAARAFAALYLPSRRALKSFVEPSVVAITAPYTSKMAAIASLNAVAPVSIPHGSYPPIGTPVRAVARGAPRVFRAPIAIRVLNGNPSERGWKGFRCPGDAPILPHRGPARRRDARHELSNDSSHRS